MEGEATRAHPGSSTGVALLLSHIARADRQHAKAMQKLQALEGFARAAETPEQRERRVYGAKP